MASAAVPYGRLLARTTAAASRRFAAARSSSARRSRCLFSVSCRRAEKHGAGAAAQWENYRQSFSFPPASPPESFRVGAAVTVHGFLGKRRDISAKAAFVDVVQPGRPRPVQIRSAWTVEGSPEHALHQQLRAAPAYSAVSVTGHVEEGAAAAPRTATGAAAAAAAAPSLLVRLGGLQVLNAFPRDIVVSKGAQFPATARHLQMRFSEALQRRLALRSDVAGWSRRHLAAEAGLCEFETPLLFKSTPEGAREFLVPTRRRGFAYALPQSPQQFKQVLMAAGVAGAGRGYFQLARCFRDEDLRADRQPEFTQLDLEMAFATGDDVMRTVERYVRRLFAYVADAYRLVRTADGEWAPTPVAALTTGAATKPFPRLSDAPFLRMPYDEAMAKHGSDKPDLRIPGEIVSVDAVLPASFTSMITKLEDPAVDAWRLRLDDAAPAATRAFVQRLFDGLPPALAKNPDGMPAVMIYDASKPLCGLAPLGYEAFEALTGGGGEETTAPGRAALADWEDGDVLFVQARRRGPFRGGSTALGQLRLEAYRAAVEQGLLRAGEEEEEEAFRFLWVVGFPMFTPTEATTTPGGDGSADPGQGGRAGFSATHHPFTAPRTAQDLDLLATEPLRAQADHYDLVVNGVELGGGSRRIHAAAVQEYVLRDVLQMDDGGVAQFAHLLEALRAGCPPHAGFALGFDRLVAVLAGTSSVRDVIAFPKTMKGEDPSVKSPGRVTPAQLATYHLRLDGGRSADGGR